jgi:hypothetical protein
VKSESKRLMPDWPLSNALKKDSGVLPTGDTTPKPVTTTLLNEVALIDVYTFLASN